MHGYINKSALKVSGLQASVDAPIHQPSSMLELLQCNHILSVFFCYTLFQFIIHVFKNMRLEICFLIFGNS